MWLYSGDLGTQLKAGRCWCLLRTPGWKGVEKKHFETSADWLSRYGCGSISVLLQLLLQLLDNLLLYTQGKAWYWSRVLPRARTLSLPCSACSQGQPCDAALWSIDSSAICQTGQWISSGKWFLWKISQHQHTNSSPWPAWPCWPRAAGPRWENTLHLTVGKKSPENNRDSSAQDICPITLLSPSVPDLSWLISTLLFPTSNSSVLSNCTFAEFMKGKWHTRQAALPCFHKHQCQVQSLRWVFEAEDCIVTLLPLLLVF